MNNRFYLILHKRFISYLIMISFLLTLVLNLSSKSIIEIKTQPQNTLQSISDEFILQAHSIEIDIQDSQNIVVIEKLTVQNNSSTTVDYINVCINQSYSDLIIEDSFGILEYSEVPNLHFLSITLGDSLPINHFTVITLTYRLLHSLPLIEESDPPYYIFQFLQPIYYYTEFLEVKVCLPERCFIHEDEFYQQIIPIPDSLVQKEYRFELAWEFDYLNLNDYKFFWILFDAPPPTDSPIWYFIVGPILALILGVVGTVWIMRKRESRAVKKIGEMFLSDVQKEFLKIIVEKEGKISQKEILAKTGYTKTRVSRNLISLEKQKLIRREKWGRNYRIYITETGERVIK